MGISHQNPTPPTDEEAAYVAHMTKRMGEKAAKIAEHRDAIAVLRKEIARDRKARNAVADRHGIAVSDA